MHTSLRPLVVAALSLLLGGCATIVKDDNQPVAFSSDPQGAVVSINGVPRGTTPATIMVERKRQKQMLEISKEGYQTVHMPLQKHIAGMTFGNIIFGGIIGFGVDYATGKGANYQDTVTIKLIPLPKPGVAAAPQNGLGLSVAIQDKQILVLSVQPDSAASAAGILVGDEITAYTENEDVPKSAEVAVAAINSPPGKSAILSWRTGAGPVKTAKLEW